MSEDNSSRSSPCKMPPEYAAIFTFCAATLDRAAEVQYKMSEQNKWPVFPVTMILAKLLIASLEKYSSKS